MFEKTLRLRFTSKAKADPQTPFDFLTDAGTLVKITPPRIKIVSPVISLHQRDELEREIILFSTTKPSKALLLLIEEAGMVHAWSLLGLINYGEHDIFIADVNLSLNKETRDVEPTLFTGKGYYNTLKNEPLRPLRSTFESAHAIAYLKKMPKESIHD